MASKTKTYRLESEIDKCRVECNWKKAVELAKQGALKSTDIVSGKCLDKTKSSLKTKYKISEREDEIITCYEIAGDLAFLCLQQRDKRPTTPQGMGPSTESNNFIVTSLIEMAIKQVPVMHWKKGEMALEEFIEAHDPTNEANALTARQALSEADDTLVKLSEGNSQFKEQALLLLAKLKFCEGFYQVCLDTLEKVDLTSIALRESEGNAYKNTRLLYMVAECFAIKEATDHPEDASHCHMMGTSLEATCPVAPFNVIQRYSQALPVLSECYRLAPQNVTVCLQAAQLCYEHLQLNQQGVEWSQRAVQCNVPKHFLARAYMALGIGLCLVAKDSRLNADRQSLNQKALEAFKTAQDLNPSDYLTAFHLALQYANLRKINVAIEFTKKSLENRSDFIHSLHLLTLLLSARKQHEEAMTLIQAALEEYPDNLSLLMTKAKLEKIVLGPDEALSTYQKMLKLWKDMHELDIADDGSDSKSKVRERNPWDKRSLAQITLNEFSERGSGERQGNTKSD
uniref:Tetratricopeptide repeat protein 7 N-terminal domain-containing protein n=1 Tax=Biomphalaria glabrata TaxID=6526 RepID=A0A2C9KRA4_BIOGL